MDLSNAWDMGLGSGPGHDYSGTCNEFYINRINVPYQYRGKGLGRRLLKEALSDADREGATLYLEINPYGEMTHQQLEAWYMRYGFTKHYIPGVYIRRPQEKTLERSMVS